MGVRGRGKIPQREYDEDLIKADRYLNIDILSVIADKKYLSFATNWPEINLLDLGQLDQNYDTLTRYAIYNDYISLFQYILNHTSPLEHKEDYSLVFFALDYHTGARIIPFLLQRDVDPTINNNRFFIRAIDRDDYQLVRTLLHNPKTDPTYPNNRPLLKAIQSGSSHSLQALLEDPRIDPSFGDNEPLALTVSYLLGGTLDGLRILQILLADKRVDPASLNNNLIIMMSTIVDAEEYFPLILSQRGIDPSVNNNMVFLNLARVETPLDTIKLLLADERFDPNVFDYDELFADDIPDKKELLPSLLNHPRCNEELKKFLETAIALRNRHASKVII